MKIPLLAIITGILVIGSINFCISDPSLRTVFWVHGFNGNEFTWQRYYGTGSPFAPPNFFPANHFTFTYGTTSGLASAANSAENQMFWGSTSSEDFAICHSMGGLTIRQIEATGNPAFEGYITVGTPNDGAFIASSFQEGSVEHFFGNLCEEVVLDPLINEFWLNTVLYILNLGPYTGIYTNEFLCNFLYNYIETSWLDEFVSPATVTDLAPNSSAINGLNSFNSTLPRIAIYGNENSPIHWRFIQSFVNAPSSLNLNQVKDSDLAKHAKYIEKGFDHLAAVCIGFSVSVWPPTLTPQYNPENSPFYPFATELSEAANWLRKSESQWGSLICRIRSPQVDQWQSYIYKGPGSSQSQTGLYQELSDSDLIQAVFNVSTLQQDCALNNDAWWPYDTHEVIQFAICSNDGIVEAYSADFLPNPENVDIIEIQFANHQQLVNHPTMTFELNKIMINGPYNQFFDVVQ